MTFKRPFKLKHDQKGPTKMDKTSCHTTSSQQVPAGAWLVVVVSKARRCHDESNQRNETSQKSRYSQEGITLFLSFVIHYLSLYKSS
jgi:hypothetical protein